jgi:uncharacterized protein
MLDLLVPDSRQKGGVMLQGKGQGAGQGCGCGGGASATGKGPKGNCVCSRCGHIMRHAPGAPCRETRCPQCGGAMTRKD